MLLIIVHLYCLAALSTVSTIGDELTYGDAIAFGDFEVVGVGDGDADGEAAGDFVRLFWGSGRRGEAGLLGDCYAAYSYKS